MTSRHPTGQPKLRKDLGTVALLLALILLAFWSIGPAGKVLAGGDLFSYFYPYWAEASRALRAGRIPLWNSLLFMGAPLLANSQAGLFYPLNWPLWLLLPPHRALHWSIILHLGIAASGIYLFARRSAGLGRWGAWTAGAALALGGYLGAQVEHINQLQALAWLPWLLVAYDGAVLGRSRFSFAGLAATVGLTLLTGHTQAAFIALTGLTIHALTDAVASGSQIARRAIILVGAAVLGAALAAIQLVPTLQLTGLSVRARGLPFNERVSFSLSPLYLARALLPSYGQPVEPESIEYVATLGMAGLALVLLALSRRAKQRHLPYLALLGLFLALGLYNPLYLLLARFVPGFAHFRAPARWLALWALEGSLLIGTAIDSLLKRQLSLSRRQWLTGSLLLAALMVWGILGGQTDPATIAGWIAAMALAAALLALGVRVPRVASAGLVALTLTELLLSAHTLPRARATAPQSYTTIRPAATHLLADRTGEQAPGRFLSISALAFDPGDLPELRLIYGDQLSDDALYDLLIATKHREVLSPNLPLALGIPAIDGYDGGVLPLERYVNLQQAFLPEDQVSLDGRLRENLTAVPDERWLDLFDIHYVITDKVFDAWLDGVFYDLQFTARLSSQDGVSAAHVPPFEATALGLVSYLEGAADLTDGTPVGQVSIGFDDGPTSTFTLLAGRHTSEGLYHTGVAHEQAVVGGHFWPGQPEGNDYVTRLRWGTGTEPTSIRVQATLPQGRLIVRGVSLIDERTDSFQSLVLSDGGHFRLAHSGDVKVYENLGATGRAHIVHLAEAADGPEQALALMRAPDFDPRTSAVIETSQLQPTAQPAEAEQERESVRITAHSPELIELEANLVAPGYLILSEATYPGWRARVDGEETQILTADLLFQAIWLDAGLHQIEFAFKPLPVRIGAAVSALGLILLLASPFAPRTRLLPTREQSPVTGAFAEPE
jgi:hypothetical protein